MERNTLTDAQGTTVQGPAAQSTGRSWEQDGPTVAGSTAGSTLGSTAGATSGTYSQASMGALFRDLFNDISDLMRKEIELARTETMEKVSTASKGAISMAAGGFLAYAGLLCLLAAGILVLATWMPYWLSATVVGLVVLVIGIIMLQAGRSTLSKANLTPEKTVDTMKDNATWVKEKIQ